ncbi:MAG TPA: SCO family protein [Burkholderiales bacterium]|nr:SCO family protein [Burkholderiales bacterium]
MLSRPARILALALLATALAAGCGERNAQKFQSTDVTGASFGRKLDLTDHNGQRRTLADFKGKVVVVFFGFTHCPDACPTTLSELSTVARELGPDAQRMQVLFVTVDPQRDTPEVLRQYVPSFHPSFLGLYGTADELAATAKEFKVYVQKQPQPGGNYTVDHSAGTFILDQEGRLRLFANYGAGAKVLLHDIRLLLGS